MSSAVNKSQKHFAPKLPRQRSAPRQDPDASRSSDSSRKQSVSQKSAPRVKRASISTGDARNAQKAVNVPEAETTESAIDDSGETSSAAPLPNQPTAARTHRRVSKAGSISRQARDSGPGTPFEINHDDGDDTLLDSASSTFLPSSTSRPASSSAPSPALGSVPSSVPSSAPSSGLSTSIAPPSSSSNDLTQLDEPTMAPAEHRLFTPAEENEIKPPPGYRFVEPAELEEHKAAERRRKQAFERELLHIMRNLYAEKEKAKILESSEEMLEEQAEELAQNAAGQATYNQLKQAVGNEAKVLRDEKFGPVVEDQGLKPMLHPTKFTMAALCKDVPFGARNDSYDDYELARVNRRRDTVRVFRAKMWSRRMYQPKEEEKSALKEAYKKYQEERQERNGKLRNEQQQKFTEIDDATGESVADSHPQASIEIQADGAISLVGTQFDRHKNNRSQREGSVGPRTEVDPTEQVINSYSFSTRERPDRWTKEETAKFYEAVSALGTDFNLISHLFPLRSRNQIKTKFKYEEKRNPAKLQMYMVSRRKFNVDSYSQVSNVPIQEVVSIEDELEKVRQEHAEQMKLEEASRLQAKAEDQKRQSTSKRSATTGNAPNPKRERVD